MVVVVPVVGHVVRDLNAEAIKSGTAGRPVCSVVPV